MAQIKYGWTIKQWDLAIKIFTALAMWFVVVQPVSMVVASWCAERVTSDEQTYDVVMFVFSALLFVVGFLALRFWIKRGHILRTTGE